MCGGALQLHALYFFFTSDYARIKKVHYSRQAIVMRADSVSLMVDENSQDNRTKGSLSWSI